mmetsp:Transcript_153499/g.268394  ORF Transcript_153499/g.268394 Transcript_153499/m.268394 type:complete len:127 (+) Transcript_153499:1721-2101(+)
MFLSVPLCASHPTTSQSETSTQARQASTPSLLTSIFCGPMCAPTQCLATAQQYTKQLATSEINNTEKKEVYPLVQTNASVHLFLTSLETARLKHRISASTSSKSECPACCGCRVDMQSMPGTTPSS